ncbi:RNA-directed RNA polymerase [Actinidia chinensis var. chinensis]|uniref:RNA-directed RNA polymerase n=1 Tax=Actinidia chinensis var. chinensis TaxID=1590841 RepID=A0A2R6RYS5_ACTCC|nr:RNA-directed RNA polymerase [Actinidia chinensis var. chinensis]
MDFFLSHHFPHRKWKITLGKSFPLLSTALLAPTRLVPNHIQIEHRRAKHDRDRVDPRAVGPGGEERRELDDEPERDRRVQEPDRELQRVPPTRLLVAGQLRERLQAVLEREGGRVGEDDEGRHGVVGVSARAVDDAGAVAEEEEVGGCG